MPSPRFVLTALLVLLALLQPVRANTEGSQDAAALFGANCAMCHGPKGHPDPENPVVKALGVMPANFSDVLFNSREPATDWFLVMKYG